MFALYFGWQGSITESTVVGRLCKISSSTESSVDHVNLVRSRAASCFQITWVRERLLFGFVQNRAEKKKWRADGSPAGGPWPGRRGEARRGAAQRRRAPRPVPRRLRDYSMAMLHPLGQTRYSSTQTARFCFEHFLRSEKDRPTHY